MEKPSDVKESETNSDSPDAAVTAFFLVVGTFAGLFGYVGVSVICGAMLVDISIYVAVKKIVAALKKE